MARLNVDIPDEIHAKAKARAIEKGIHYYTFVNNAIKHYLECRNIK